MVLAVGFILSRDRERAQYNELADSICTRAKFLAGESIAPRHPEQYYK